VNTQTQTRQRKKPLRRQVITTAVIIRQQVKLRKKRINLSLA